MQNRLTIKDIARLSGVGKSTVSRVLNNEGHVSPQTRERVLAVIEQQSFLPSKSARAMRGQSDKVVAIIVSRLDSPSENEAVRTMLPLLYEQGYDPIVMESKFSVQRVQEHLQVLHQRAADGVILFGFTGLDEQILEGWQEKTVIVARQYQGFSSVCYDDSGAVNLLLNQLYQQGHRHISYMGTHEADTTTGALRTQAYQAFCEHKQLEPVLILGELTYHSGYELAEGILRPDTTAVICASDSIALGVAKYLQQQQKSDITLCGIGNNLLMRFLFPQALTVELGYGRAGTEAVRLLMSQLHSAPSGQQIIVPCQLADPLP